MTTKVNIWYYSDGGFPTLHGAPTRPQRWGHAGIKFKDLPSPYRNAYFSLYPVEVARGPLPNSGGVIRRDRHADMADEACGIPGFERPDRIISCQNLSVDEEIRAYETWLEWERRPPTYFAVAMNCCTAVAQSLGADTALTNSGIWTPTSLEAWIISRHGTRERY